MAKVKRQFSEDELLYDTFHPLRELGRGGQARVLEVRADRSAPGFRLFLAASIAWEEVARTPQVKPLRREITALNRQIQDLHEEEAELMDAGDEGTAEEVRRDIDELLEDIDDLVGSLKTKQQYYIDKRKASLADDSAEAMIKHLGKLGLEYPDDDIFAMKQELRGHSETILRMQDEFKSLKLVRHENIITVYDVGEDYYIMELVRDIVECDRIVSQPGEEQIYTNEERINIIIEAARAVEYAHLFGIIHRDIKPENIAVNEVGNVKLMDFGLAKSAETEGVTVTGEAMGTSYFMSMEQIGSSKEASPTFDIYALGASLYNYITGERPYKRARNKYSGKDKETRSAQDVLMTVANMSFHPIPPSEIAEGIPAVLEDIILKAMAKEKRFRYQSVGEFREDLEKYLSLADNGTLQSGSFFGINSQEINMRVRRREHRSSHERIKRPAESQTQKTVMAVIIGIAAFLILLVLVLSGKKDPNEGPESGGEGIQTEERENVAEMYDYAVEYSRRHSDNYRTCVEKFQKVKVRAEGTKYELMAEDRIAELAESREERKAEVLAGLARDAGVLTEENLYDAAIEVYAVYAGPLSLETSKARGQRVRELKAEKEAWLQSHKLAEVLKEQEREKLRKAAEERAAREKAEGEAKARARLDEMTLRVADDLKFGQIDRARKRLRDELNSEGAEDIQAELKEMQAIAEVALDMHTAMVRSYRQAIGKPVVIETIDGVKKGTVKTVDSDKVSIERKSGSRWSRRTITETISLKNISVRQKIAIAKPDLRAKTVLIALVLEAEAKGETEVASKLSADLGPHVLAGEIKSKEPAREPAPTASPPEEQAEAGWINLVAGDTLAEAGWQPHLADASLGTGWRLDGGRLVKPLTSKTCRLRKEIDLKEGEIAFDFELGIGTSHSWEFTILEAPDTGDANGAQAGFYQDFRGKHSCRIIVKGKGIVCFFDGKPAARKDILVQRVFSTPLLGRAFLIFSAARGTSLTISNLRYRPVRKKAAAAKALGWTYLFPGDDDSKLKHDGATYTLNDGVLRVIDKGTSVPVGIEVPKGRIRLEYEARIRTDKKVTCFLKGVKHAGQDRSVQLFWYSDGRLAYSDYRRNGRLTSFGTDRSRRKSGGGWQRFAYVISDEHLKASWEGGIFYDGPIPPGYADEVGFAAEGFRGFIDIRNARYKILADAQGTWIDLIKGKSRKESGWYCKDPASVDNFKVTEDKLMAPGGSMAKIYKDLELGNGDIEFEYNHDLKSEWYEVRIFGPRQSLRLKFNQDAGGLRHLRIVIKGTEITGYLDGVQVPVDGSKGIHCGTLASGLKGKGYIQFISAAANTPFTVTDLRYRLLKRTAGN